jgi:hypothetical protein
VVQAVNGKAGHYYRVEAGCETGSHVEQSINTSRATCMRVIVARCFIDQVKCLV